MVHYYNRFSCISTDLSIQIIRFCSVVKVHIPVGAGWFALTTTFTSIGNCCLRVGSSLFWGALSGLSRVLCLPVSSAFCSSREALLDLSGVVFSSRLSGVEVGLPETGATLLNLFSGDMTRLGVVWSVVGLSFGPTK